MDAVVRRLDPSEIRKFIELPYRLYKNHPIWVPPLRVQMKEMFDSNKNLFMRNEHAFFMAFDGNKPVARILAGYNNVLSEKKGEPWAFLALFEAEDKESGRLVLQAAEQYAKEMGAVCLMGPYSPTDGEEERGILIEGFDKPQVLMTAYHPAWYREVFEEAGFSKHEDILALYIDVASAPVERFVRAVTYAEKKYGFKAQKIDLKNFEKELKDIYEILKVLKTEDLTADLSVPSWEQVLHEGHALKEMADPDFVYIVRTNEGKPVAFVVGMPNYNEVIQRMNGRLFPFGLIKFLLYKKSIKSLRVFMQFAIPEYRGKAAISAAYLKMMIKAGEKGYIWAEASTIGEENYKSFKPVEDIGGKVYRRFRYFEKKLI